MASAGRRVLRSVLFATPVIVTAHDFLGSVASVRGRSMQPEINPDLSDSNPSAPREWVLLNRLSLRWGERPRRGQVVALRSPTEPDSIVVKRIIATEGDVIKSRGYKEVYVRIPLGHCWVEGDSAAHSCDSNSYGPIPRGLIVAKVTHVVWPPSRWHPIERHFSPDRLLVASAKEPLPECLKPPPDPK